MPPKKRRSLNYMTPRERERLKLKKSSASPKPSSSRKQKGAHSLVSNGKENKKKSNDYAPKSARGMQQDQIDDSSPSSSKENSLEISIKPVGKNKRTSSKIVNTTQNRGHKLKSPSKPLSTDDEDKATKLNTSFTKSKKRKSINFISPKDKRPIVYNQSMSGHTLTRGSNVDTSASSFEISTSSISKLSDTHGGRLDSQSSESSPYSTSSTTRTKPGQKRKLTGEKVKNTTSGGGQAKKRKTSRNSVENQATSLITTRSSTSSSTRSKPLRRAPKPMALDRIKDLKVTKKAFEKWKPISKVTVSFVDAILKSVILNVNGEANFEDDDEAASCLSTLKSKVMERLPKLKAPYTKSDYRKMESENKLSEEVYLEKCRELNVLDKKIEEEQRLLDTQTSMVVDFTKKLKKYEDELEIVEKAKAHPLIKETKNVLNLPQLPDDFFIEDETSIEESPEVADLRNTLLQLRQNTNDAGLEKWMNKLTVITKKLHEH